MQQKLIGFRSRFRHSPSPSQSTLIMLAAYTLSRSGLARTALGIALRSIRPTSTATIHNPLKVDIETDDLGLPITPLPLAIPAIPSKPISRETLVKLYRLSALDPPEEGSTEETELKDELAVLMGLMDIVQKVKLPPGDLRDITAELLGEGVGEIVFDEHVAEARPGAVDSIKASEVGDAVSQDGISGRELLDWATRRVGDYYAARVK